MGEYKPTVKDEAKARWKAKIARMRRVKKSDEHQKVLDQMK